MHLNDCTCIKSTGSYYIICLRFFSIREYLYSYIMLKAVKKKKNTRNITGGIPI